MFFILKISNDFNKFFINKEINFKEIYGENSYVVITGASSGQGKHFAFEFAKRGLNLLLIGSKKTEKTQQEINNIYPNIKIKNIIVDFCKAYKKNFFTKIKREIENIDVSILVNNIGHRVAWNPYHEMPQQKINDSIICGTIVQSQMTRLVIPNFLKRKNNGKKSALIFITAQCIHSNYFINSFDNILSLPYVSVYEASNVFGYAHANSIFQEYKDDFDILNITPGAVITENTQYLRSTILSVNCDIFVQTIMKLIGNVQGNSCGCWQHELSLYLVAIFPFIKPRILKETGKLLANQYMNKII
jgi:17beta-estradiol 17-dehydrogenase / very-long-chain 3-oxoacyl-CoA reductase